jgi:SAM-dependent methyltransferase
VSPTIRDEPPAELEDVRAGRLPDRYGYRMQDVFIARLTPLLVPGARILDVGAGRAPTLALRDRPPGSWYAGLDISAAELAAAPAGAYDELLIHDIATPVSADARFDLAISWQVLEHVGDLAAALENLRLLLRPGGTLFAQLSGSNAAFSLIARALPHRARAHALSRWLGHSSNEKFPIAHQRRTADVLERALAPWSTSEIVPFYRGATYFAPLRPVQRAYLVYESALARRQARNLATHYLIIADR